MIAETAQRREDAVAARAAVEARLASFNAPRETDRRTAALREVARAASVQEVYECRSCGAHRPMGYRCCGMYVGTMGEAPVQRRNVHLHPEADEDEVADFLRALLQRHQGHGHRRGAGSDQERS